MQFLERIFFRNGQDKVTVRKIYDHLLSGALASQLYENDLSADSFDGRFEQVALHSALVLRTLQKNGQPKQADALVQMVFSGFDHAYRETGVGDSSISRKVRKLGERFYGLARGLNGALEAEDDQELRAFIERNGLANGSSDMLANYLRRADKALRENQDVFDAVWPSVRGIDSI